MKTKLFVPALFMIGVWLFNLLFWEQFFGINLSIFALFLCFLSVASQNFKKLSRPQTLSLIAVIVTSITTTWHLSGLSVTSLIVSVFIFLGFSKQEQLQSALSAFLSNVVHAFGLPFSAYDSISSIEQQNSKLKKIGKGIKIGLIPILISLIFFAIYREANSEFKKMSEFMIEYLNQLFTHFSFLHFFFLLFGLTWICFAFLPTKFKLKPFLNPSATLLPNQAMPSDSTSKDSWFSSLKSEYQSGLILLGILNALLLIVNLIDIQWIWFDFEVPLEFNLKQFVHEGTYLLILSILLSIAILLFYFRGDLNFYPKNKALLWMARIWVAQNFILTISLFIRNYHYISYHGLAGKRIGVIAFLLMTAFGLITLLYKIEKQKSASFLLQINSWFVLFSLVGMSVLNWDKVIVNYNLNHSNPAEIDVDHYLYLDASTAPIILANLDKVEAQMNAHLNRENKERWIGYTDIDSFEVDLVQRTEQYLQRKSKYSWQCWNYSDYKLRREMAVGITEKW